MVERLGEGGKEGEVDLEGKRGGGKGSSKRAWAE